MDKLVNNIEDVKSVLTKYNWIEEQSERLIDDWYFEYIDRVELNGDDDIIIFYETCCRGCWDKDSVSVPISWLFLSDEELAVEKQKKKEREEEERRRQQELNKALEEQEKEKKEREEYERLKKKFGG